MKESIRVLGWIPIKMKDIALCCVLDKDHVYRMVKEQVQQYLTKPNHCIWPIRTHYTFVSTNDHIYRILTAAAWYSGLQLLPSYIWSLGGTESTGLACHIFTLKTHKENNKNKWFRRIITLGLKAGHLTHSSYNISHLQIKIFWFDWSCSSSDRSCL